jgi:hypothetical protein
MYLTDGPGPWQQFIKRADNQSLPIMEAKRKYLVEQTQHEQQMLSMLGTVNSGASFGGDPSPRITINDVINAQQAWAGAVVAIGNAYGAGENLAAATSLASSIIDAAYNYDNQGVFFRPTLTTHPTTFRNTKEGALCYFVGGCGAPYAGDTGFALNRWSSVSFNNYPGGTATSNIGIVLANNDTVAFTMGYVTFSNAQNPSSAFYPNGTVTVDKTFGYVKDSNGNMKINLHISALTNNPQN